MRQAKAAVAALNDAEQAQVSVVGITLDAKNDTPERLRQMAAGQGVSAPGFRLGTGQPEVVDKLLDDLDVSRKRDPVTGVIDHANLFFVVDRKGRIAYRLTIGERQQQWLIAALRSLIAEPGGLGGRTGDRPAEPSQEAATLIPSKSTGNQ